MPITVVIGPGTGRAGSMVTITFRGRPNTFLSGSRQPAVTRLRKVNFSVHKSDLSFATNYVADRNSMIKKTVVYFYVYDPY